MTIDSGLSTAHQPHSGVVADQTACADRTELRIEIAGIVQGVGFRPFVHRLASELELDGCVGNDRSGVVIEVAGPPEALEVFRRRLITDAPPLAMIESLVASPTDPFRPREQPRTGDGAARRGFSIVASSAGDGSVAEREQTLVPADTAPCDDCVAELADPADRRFGHPFITCTNCGPRFTIIRSLPYDRPATTMADFELCPACANEYHDPADRRHHAQPIGCHDCGPRLRLSIGGAAIIEGTGSQATVALLDRAAAALTSGLILAVKGIGGFHLACDATTDDIVGRLRTRKRRPDKPFAVMVADVDAARRLAHVDDDEAAVLRSAARPVVLLRARDETPLSALVAPGNPLIGVMLPSSPLHMLLLDALGGRPLVMTSGNVAGEPICHRDDEAASRLGPLVDGVLGHDRPIHVACDDSVVRLVGSTGARQLLPIRRARGWAPLPVVLPVAADVPSVLAVGAELKNTFCLTSGSRALLSQHIGDMENLETLSAFDHAVGQFRSFHGVDPAIVAVDAHPGYQSSRWGRRLAADEGVSVVEIQHHEAHVGAVMAEHQLDPSVEVLGFAFDGTGYGDDGTIWGGEVFAGSARSLARVAHLAPVQLPGGDAAIRQPARIALAHLHRADIDWNTSIPAVAAVADSDRALLRHQLDRSIGCVPTTSMGRFFDAVASLLGVRHDISYEAQAAIELEILATEAASAASSSASAGDPRYVFDLHVADGQPIVIDPQPLLESLVVDVLGGRAPGELALAVHNAVARMIVDLSALLARSGQPVLLSGGVFQNALLVEETTARLTVGGHDVRTHRLVPANDGGLSLGQAYLAATRTTPVIAVPTVNAAIATT